MNRRGFSLLTAMIVIVVATLMVVGAITFTGTERSAAVLYTRGERLSGCAQAARNMFISQVRALQGNLVSTSLDAGISDSEIGTMILRSAHYSDSPATLLSVTRLESATMSASAAEASSMDNKTGDTPILAGYYQITALCRLGEDAGPEQEIEFVLKVGL